MMERLFENAIKIAHHWLAHLIQPGDLVVDATAGNGYDTCFLANLVGPQGHVVAVDIQQAAVNQTTERLKQMGLIDRVKLYCASHEQMEDFVREPAKAVVFNLGYLPGGDRKVITTPDSTLKGLESSARMLTVGGIITIVVYSGHPGGIDESRTVDEWVANLPQTHWDVVQISFTNRLNYSPYLIMVQKRGGEHS